MTSRPLTPEDALITRVRGVGVGASISGYVLPLNLTFTVKHDLGYMPLSIVTLGWIRTVNMRLDLNIKVRDLREIRLF